MRTITQTKKQTVVNMCLAVLMAAGAWQVAHAERNDDDNSRNGLRVIGLTDTGRLVSFRARSPERTRDLGYVTGLTGADMALVGIDFRVQDGKLYGVGNGGGVYTIDPKTAEATFVNALTVPLTGTVFGVDFNPAADRLRIISDTGQNLAHNVNVGGVTLVNGTLTYTAPPASPVPALGVTAAAYTNNDLNQPNTGTTLFDLDTTLDQVVIQSPPGNGILVATGKLGVDVAAARLRYLQPSLRWRDGGQLPVRDTLGEWQIPLLRCQSHDGPGVLAGPVRRGRRGYRDPFEPVGSAPALVSTNQLRNSSSTFAACRNSDPRSIGAQRHEYGTMSACVRLSIFQMECTAAEIPGGARRQLDSCAHLVGRQRSAEVRASERGASVSLPIVPSKRPGTVALDNAAIHDITFP